MGSFKFKLDVSECETVTVCAGGIVDSIRVGDGDRAGGSGGSKHEFTLHEGETIVRISGTRVRFPGSDSDLVIGEIKFETNMENVHGPFGESMGHGIEQTFDFQCIRGKSFDDASNASSDDSFDDYSDNSDESDIADVPEHTPGLRKLSGKAGDYVNSVECKF